MPRSPILTLALALTLAAPGLPALETALLSDGTLGYQYGRQQSQNDALSSTNGWVADWYLSPMVALAGKKLVLRPSWDFSYSGVANPLKVDNTRYLFLHSMLNTLTLGGSYSPFEDGKLKLAGAYTALNARQSEDENLGTGLYNYQDVTGRLGWQQRFGALPLRLELGGELTDRRYPNYQNLADGSREKDARIVAGLAQMDLVLKEHPSTLLDLRYRIESQAYTEATVVDATGTTASGKKRRDLAHQLHIGLPISRQSLQVELGYSFEYRDSNYAVNDIEAGEFFEHYLSYMENGLNLAVGWQFPAFWLLERPQATVSGAFSRRSYLEQQAQDKDGNYTGSLAWEGYLTGGLGLSSALGENFGLYLNYTFTRSSTNNENAQLAGLSYTLHAISTGVQWTY